MELKTKDTVEQGANVPWQAGLYREDLSVNYSSLEPLFLVHFSLPRWAGHCCAGVRLPMGGSTSPSALAHVTIPRSQATEWPYQDIEFCILQTEYQRLCHSGDLSHVGSSGRRRQALGGGIKSGFVAAKSARAIGVVGASQLCTFDQLQSFVRNYRGVVTDRIVMTLRLKTWRRAEVLLSIDDLLPKQGSRSSWVGNMFR